MTEAEFYDRLTSIRPVDLAAETRSGCAALVLDHLGCALFGVRLPWVQRVEAVTRKMYARGSHRGDHLARVYGREPDLPAPQAALVNGTAAHGFDLDDLHYPTMTHPGSVVIPAALAAAEAVEASGVELVAGVVAGYEAMTSVSAAIGLEPGERGFHATSLCGPIGSGVAAVKILGGGRQEIEDVIGIAASLGSGVKAFQHGPGDVKRLHAGHAAESGLKAAELALAGFPAPRSALTGPFGFVPTIRRGGPSDTEGKLPSRRDELAIDRIYLKPYAACGALHGLMRAGELLATDLVGETQKVVGVELGCPRRVLEQNDIVSPTDSLTAQYSAQYAVAVALMGQARNPAAFDPDNGDGEERARLCRVTRLEVDAAVDAAYPKSNQGRIRLRLDDGSIREAFGAMDETSSSGWDVAAEKFAVVAATSLASEDVLSIAKAVEGLAAVPSVRSILDLISIGEDDV